MILTISIPTYNRAQELEVLLSEILSQLCDVPAESVNVLVSDNASTDGTALMVDTMRKNFAERSVELKYVRNDKNIGFSRNVINAVGKADGEFVLIMGDDDSLEPHTIGFLLESIDRHQDADLLFLKATEYDSNLSCIEPSTEEGGSTGEQIYGDGVEYIHSKRGYPPALVSGYVVRKSVWLSSTPEDFAYSICVHMLAAGRLLLRHSCAVEIGRPCIKYRGGQQNTTWSRDELYPFRFYLDSLMATKIMDGEAERRALNVLRNLSLRTIAFYLLRQKVMKHPFAEEQFADFYLRARGGLSIYSFMIAAIRASPRFVVCVLFGHWIRAINAQMGFCWKGESKK